LDDKARLRKSILIPAIFVAILWIIRVAQEYFHWEFIFLGIRPRNIEGLIGIFSAPFIHSGYDHLLSNTLPLLVVGSGIIYFYREISIQVISVVWLFTGAWVWLFARPDSHIGASGLIYGFVCFLFFSGIFRRDPRLLAISFLVTFLYGSLVWGILPINQGISWESHLFGSVAGIIASVYYRKEGPQRKVKVWEEEPEPTGPQYWMTDEQKKKFESHTTDSNTINYIYKEKEKE